MRMHKIIFKIYSIKKMNKIYYAFTVKYTMLNKMPMPSDYEAWMNNAEKKGFDIQCHYFELDKKGRLHIHGCAIADKNFYKKSVLHAGYHQKIDAIPSFMDLQVWSDYISKDYVNREEYDQKILSYIYHYTEDSPFQA